MPLYDDLKTETPAGQRTLEKLLELRKALKVIPERTLHQKLLLASWNIREFDSNKYGSRIDEAFYYIAEIIDHFDLVAIQEVRDNLTAFKRLCSILGEHWKAIFTDTAGGQKGNRERMAFLYDSRKIRFGGLAGELVIPDVKTKVVDPDGKTEKVDEGQIQFARTPFIVGFSSSYTDFMLCTVHIIWGSAQANDERRVDEIHKLAKTLSERTTDETAWARNLILLGDFNIFNRDDATLKAITDEDFVIPKELQTVPGSNVNQDKHYDQMAFKIRDNILEPTGAAGVFDFYETIFRDEDEETYIEAMGDAYFNNSKGEPRTERGKKTHYRTWRTFQISDHLPMWIELRIDYTDEYLQRLHQDDTK